MIVANIIANYIFHNKNKQNKEQNKKRKVLSLVAQGVEREVALQGRAQVVQARGLLLVREVPRVVGQVAVRDLILPQQIKSLMDVEIDVFANFISGSLELEFLENRTITMSEDLNQCKE